MNVVPSTPIGNICLCSGVPLDRTYSDTLTFSNATEQHAYFASKIFSQANDCGPVRLQNRIRYPSGFDSIAKCNYLMFQNKNYGTRWFYAFITGMNYINPNMTEIEFELDVWQTWQFEINVKQCYVEREHPNNDDIGTNVIPENLEHGEYFFNGFTRFGISTSKQICIASTVTKLGNPVDGNSLSSIYNGCAFYFFDEDEANDFLKEITSMNKADAVVAVFMIDPDFFSTTASMPKTTTISLEKKYDSISGYIPKNNKLFTYPYNFIYATNYMGESAEFRYEDFLWTDDCLFRARGTLSTVPEITVSPISYKWNQYDNINEHLSVKGFPMCAYNIDAFKAWLAQNGTQFTISTVGTAINDALGFIGNVLSGNIVGAAQSGVATVTNVYSAMAQKEAIKAKPPQANGTPTPSALFAQSQLDVHLFQAQISYSFAKQIDDYFSAFGYQTNQLKVPNITGRPYWNYVKCYDAKVVGNAPYGDMETIKQTLNRGITFWHNQDVGNYNRINK